MSENNNSQHPPRLQRDIFANVVAGAVVAVATWIAEWLWQTTKGLMFAIIFMIVVQSSVTIVLVYQDRRKREKVISDLQKELTKLESELKALNTGDVSSIGMGYLDLARFCERTEQHHWFVHTARDLVVNLLKGAQVVRDRHAPIVPAEQHESLQSMLDHMAKMFQMLVPPGTKVFTALRERRGLIDKAKYVTILRGGDCNKPKREQGSEPLTTDMQMVKDLLKSFHEQFDCVLLTGSSASNWQQGLRNNGLGEDKCVLMGAVFSKAWLKHQKTHKPASMEWIVTVAANTDGVFTEQHKNLMKCFNDVLSLVLNVILRKP